MKNIFTIFLFFTSCISFAQQDVDVTGNKVTIKESAPVWPGCENSKDQKACFNAELMQHIKENYKYPRNNNGDLIRGKAVIKLEINKAGEVVVRSVEGEKPEVNLAAETMIKKIPKLKPGRKGGKPTTANYTIPLTL
ncbi:energy transducer TonB [Autumnicola musiva]|uniref:Energy transducer TonB n=1 Tax=Autumnicola musiva TaxID=3075589 RepID=A0ABU3D6R5_9FLAO|nr:energy transducer TonB [Zunongwangia sp. F117]MDT0677121.1 energy transducer TonB [Zunongwangia sp. F117]